MKDASGRSGGGGSVNLKVRYPKLQISQVRNSTNTYVFMHNSLKSTRSLADISETQFHSNVRKEQRNKMQISIFYQNCRGLRTKISEFFNNVLLSNHDIIIISESWLCDTIFDSQLFDNRYIVLRRDRNLKATGKSKGGGVIIAAKREFNFNVICVNTCELNFECILAKFVLNFQTIYICVVYIPPNSDKDVYDSLFQTIESHCPIGSTILIAGDFNFPEITGSEYSFLHATTNCKLLFNFMSLYDLKSINNIPNQNGRTLDLVLTNVTEPTIEREEYPLVAEDRHHPALLISIFLNKTRKQNSKPIITGYNFRKANYKQLYKMLTDVNFDCLLHINQVNSAVDKFYELIYKVFNECIPQKIVPTRTFPSWFTSNIIKKIKQKSHHRKKWKKGIADSMWHKEEFNRLRKEIKLDLVTAYKAFVENSERSIQNNPKYFWNYVKDKTRHLPPNTFTYNSRELTDGRDIVDAFASHFQSVYNNTASKYDTDTLSSDNKSDLLDQLHLTKISMSEIEDAIKALKPKSSYGPDNIPPYIIKGCADAFKWPLYIILNLSLDTNVFPSKWKETTVCPIPKQGRTKDITNHRPISLLSAFAKIYESILQKRLLLHVKPVLSVYQHGFLQDRSTMTNLTILTDFLTSELDKGGQVDVIYTDFSKAFDTVDHDVLLFKLTLFNLSPQTIKLFASYLRNRKQKVLYRGYMSDSFQVLSGVPQGSNLGPLLFLILINDIPTVLQNSSPLLYADDLKFYRVIHSLQDCTKLQDDLENVRKWCEDNKLSLNLKKCQSMSFTRKTKYVKHDYTVSGTTLTNTNFVKDLGIIFDSGLTFGRHIDTITNESHRNLGLICRLAKDFSNYSTTLLLYYSYVRAKLEYSSIIWTPTTRKDNDIIERIQNKFLRILTYSQTHVYPKYTPYSDLVHNYGIQTLENRRRMHDLMFLYQIIHNKIDSVEITSKLMLAVPSGKTRMNNTRTFHCTRPRTNILQKSPLWRISASYNDLAMLNRNVDIFGMTKEQFKKIVIDSLL